MKFKGWLYVILSGLVLVAAILLVVWNVGLHAEFTLYVHPYQIAKENGNTVGGVNTALLMVLCVAFGVITPFLVKLFFHGLSSLRKAGKEKRNAEAAAQKIATKEQKKHQASARNTPPGEGT